MKDSKYTFLLPAYKATYFEEALVSIQNQSFRNFKVLVSDDCSPENLESVFKKVVGQDSRFTFRRNAENMGSNSLVSHWNLLVDMCDTEYLIMASDDDVYDEHFLEEMDRLVARYPMVGLFRSKVRRISARGESFEEDPPVNEYDSLTDFLFQTYNYPRIHCIGNYLFKTDPLKAKGKFMDFSLAWFSDDATTIICAENGVCNTPDILFSFRESDINISKEPITNGKNALKKIIATEQFYDWFCQFYDVHYCDSSLLNRVKWEQIQSGVRDRVYYLIILCCKKLKFLEFKSLYYWMVSRAFFHESKKRFDFIGIWCKAFILNKFS